MRRDETGAAEVASELSLSSEYADWLSQLDAVGSSDISLRRPCGDDVISLLRSMGCSESSIRDVVSTWPQESGDPGRWWLLDRCHRILAATLGDFDADVTGWPRLPAPLGAAGRCFYFHLIALTFPTTLAWYRSRGIPDDVARATFRDVGRHEQIHRRIWNATGVDVPGWLMLHLRGVIFELGRLQFAPMRFKSKFVTTPGQDGPNLGEAVLDVHIPAEGSLDPAACEESHRQAAVFFSQYFPDPPRRFAVCSSWLLDDQLAEYLPPNSNILAFQRSFHLVPNGVAGDRDVIDHVFRNRGVTPGLAAATTLLERSVLLHLQRGRHFRSRTGWRLLEP